MKLEGGSAGESAGMEVFGLLQKDWHWSFVADVDTQLLQRAAG